MFMICSMLRGIEEAMFGGSGSQEVVVI